MQATADRPKRSLRHKLGYAVVVAASALAAYLLYRTLSRYDWAELVAAVTAVSWPHLLGAIGFTAASYLALTGFDWLAVRYAGHPLAYRRVALASFTSLSIGHNIGFAALSSGAIRYRFYARWGLSGGAVARVIFFCGLTVGLGLSILGGIALLIHPDLAIEVLGLSPHAVAMTAAACLAWPALYLVLAAVVKRPLRVRGHEFRMPALKLALAQAVIGPLNFAFVAAALHQAVLAVADVSYLAVAAAYVSANVATLITHAPGGLGVIESVVLYLLPGERLIGAVLVFRFVYFLLPLVLGGVSFALSEAFVARASRRR